MTERFEVKNIRENLQSIFDELKYEAATRPGEGLEIEALFLSAAQKTQEAIELLEKATKLIKR
jgi:hypothetical protein